MAVVALLSSSVAMGVMMRPTHSRHLLAHTARATVVSSRSRRSRQKSAVPGVPIQMQPSIDGHPPDVARCYPERYDELLSKKVSTFEELLGNATDVPLPTTAVFRSAPLHFRMRASFKMWRNGPRVHYVMYNRDNTKVPHEVVTYPMGSRQLNALMGPLRCELERVEELRHKINDVTFLTTQTGDALVTITYNRPIEPEVWGVAAEELSSTLGGVHLVGRSRKVKIVVGGERVRETLVVKGRGECHYMQTEGAFSQPNAGVCEHMLSWAYDVTRGSTESDLCELYCGNGCFTIALAPNAPQQGSRIARCCRPTDRP